MLQKNSPKKKYAYLSIALPFAILAFLGCASGNCRSLKEKQSSAKIESEKIQGDKMNRVKIYKANGSLQCNQGLTISLNEMAKDLNGITVYSSQTKNDGKMRTQVCGNPTGDCHVYEIDRSDLPKALEKGFKEWTFE